MDTTLVADRADAPARPETAPRALGGEVAGLPVPVWGAILSCLAMIVGWNWDISWHRTVGRDTVWTLAHVSIYVALAIAFAYNATLVLSHTFGGLRAAPGIRILGFKGPSAAFVTLWGLLLQFAAILFDNWWHDVYGLDVGVFSPPHGLLAWGIAIFYLGQFGVVGLYRNTAPPAEERRALWAVIVIWSMFLGHMAIAADPLYGPMAVRSIFFVATSALTFPFGFAFLNAYLGRKGGAAGASFVYMGIVILLMQLFQLFTAKPQFGPVFHHIATFLPPPFPLLLVVPALVVGWTLPPDRDRNPFGRYLLTGAAFVVAFNVTNWLTSALLVSPLAMNRFFGGMYPGTVFEQATRRAPRLAPNAAGFIAVAVALVVASYTAWLGHRGGRWMREVVR